LVVITVAEAPFAPALEGDPVPALVLLPPLLQAAASRATPASGTPALIGIGIRASVLRARDQLLIVFSVPGAADVAGGARRLDRHQ
jgi:hypothetical protein